MEAQKVSEDWVQQHGLVCINQTEFAQLGSSTGMADSVHELINLLVGNTGFFWADERIDRVTTKRMRQVVDQS